MYQLDREFDGPADRINYLYKSPMLFIAPDYELVVMPMLTSENRDTAKSEAEQAEPEVDVTEVEEAEAVVEAEAITKPISRSVSEARLKNQSLCSLIA